MDLFKALDIIEKHSPFPDDISIFHLIRTLVIKYFENDQIILYNSIVIITSYSITIYPKIKDALLKDESVEYLNASNYLKEYLTGLEVMRKLTT